MKVLSLFDGMSCGQLALNRLGIKVDTYYASEIDKYAMQVTQANFPETIQVGDVCNLDPNDFKDVDLMLAGSPCQGFSFAGKQLAFDDPRSALFFEFIRLLKEIKPKYFLLENVKMKKEYLQVISEQVSACYPEIPFGIEPIFINSSLVSAQNRQRYYWTNIPNITQPEERGIVLRDILETEPNDPTLMSDNFVYRQIKNKKDRCLVTEDKEKASSLSAMEYVKNGRQGDYLACDNDGVPVDKELGEGHKQDLQKEILPSFDENLKKMTTKDEKAYCLTTRYSAAYPPNSLEKKQRTMIPVEEGQELPEDISLVYDNEGKSHKPKRVGTIKDGGQGNRIYSKDGKGITLSAQSGGTAGNGNMLVETSDKPEHIGTAVDVNGHDILKRVYSPDGKSPTVTTCQGGNTEPKVVAGAWRGRYNEDGSTSQKLELRKDEKANAITTVQKDSFVVQSYREVRTEEAKKARKENRQKTGKDHTPFRAKELQPRDDGKVGTVTPALNNDHKISLTKNDTQEVYWRKLTPLECERLQTVPDNYTNHVSNTQRYKMLGNGWTIEVITHILKNMEL